MPATGSKDRLWGASDVAKYLGVAEGTVNQWVKARKLPVVKVGTLNRFRKEDIDAWVAARVEGGGGVGE